ncbi:MAG: hypothetical protein ACI81V_000761 [Lentimonas sp.]|jgi:hypothetical protein
MSPQRICQFLILLAGVSLGAVAAAPFAGSASDAHHRCVVLQDRTPLAGGAGWSQRQSPSRAWLDPRGGLKFQEHENPVLCRKSWIRPLRPRQFQGGSAVSVSRELSLPARAGIAAAIRQNSLIPEILGTLLPVNAIVLKQG